MTVVAQTIRVSDELIILMPEAAQMRPGARKPMTG